MTPTLAPTNSEMTMWAIRLLRSEHLHIDPIAVQHVAQIPLDDVIAEMARFEQAGYQIYTYYPDIPDGCIIHEQSERYRASRKITTPLAQED